MECLACDKIVEFNKRGKLLAYHRVGNVGVLISACDKHFIEITKPLGGSGVVYRINDLNKINFNDYKCEWCGQDCIPGEFDYYKILIFHKEQHMICGECYNHLRIIRTDQQIKLQETEKIPKKENFEEHKKDCDFCKTVENKDHTEYCIDHNTDKELPECICEQK